MLLKEDFNITPIEVRFNIYEGEGEIKGFI